MEVRQFVKSITPVFSGCTLQGKPAPVVISRANSPWDKLKSRHLFLARINRQHHPRLSMDGSLRAAVDLRL
jgi:hypothetical protein